MARAIGAIRGVVKSRQEKSLGADFGDFVRNLAMAILDPYRPELHYMRGPGPKWRAKHNPATTAFDAVVVPVLVRIKAR
jgi:hypothetical protein